MHIIKITLLCVFLSHKCFSHGWWLVFESILDMNEIVSLYKSIQYINKPTDPFAFIHYTDQDRNLCSTSKKLFQICFTNQTYFWLIRPHFCIRLLRGLFLELHHQHQIVGCYLFYVTANKNLLFFTSWYYYSAKASTLRVLIGLNQLSALL